jgi:tetratricopeptide (TPR) repeat protein
MSRIANPYFAGPPATDPKTFFGRQDVLRFVDETLASPMHNMIVFYGQRRIGKTSILYQIAHRSGQDYQVVFFDLQSSADSPAHDLLYTLAREVADQLKLPTPARADFEHDPDTFRTRFLPQVYNHLGDRRLLLLLDEFDALSLEATPAELDALPFVKALNRAIQSDDRQVVFLFVVGRRLKDLSAQQLQIFRGGRDRQVGLLKKEATLQLITRPAEGILTYQDAAIERIWMLTGGHPYFTQLVCYQIFNQAQRQNIWTVAQAHVETVIDDAINAGQSALQWFWDEVPPVERFTLYTIGQLEAEGEGVTLDQLIARRDAQKAQLDELELRALPDQLADRQVLRRDLEDRYHFSVELVRRWIVRTHSLEGVTTELTRVAVDELAKTFFRAGLAAYQANDIGYAIDSFSRVLSINPYYVEARLWLARARAKTGDLLTAIDEFAYVERSGGREAREARLGLADARAQYGQQLEEQGKTKEAMQEYQRVLELDSQHTLANTRLSEIFRQQAEEHRSEHLEHKVKQKANIPRFDVFLSHSSVDRGWATKLKDDLLRYNVSVWLDKDEIRPGSLFAEALEQALDNCQSVALIASPEALASGWVRKEYYRALSLADNLQLIPVILRDAALPGFLKDRNWVDFRDEATYSQNVWKLVWGITGQKPGQILDLSTSGLTSTAPIQPGNSQRTSFIYRRPVPPSHFIGREREVAGILSQLANPSRGSSAISGDPRIGKTSLLHYVCEPQVREVWGLSSAWCHCLYLHCHNIIPFSEAAFWRYTLRELQRHLADDRALSNNVQRLLTQAGFDVFDLNGLFDEIARAGRLAVLILDEFEGIVENLDPHEPGLLYRLRALVSRPKRGLALLVSTREPLKQLCAGLRFAGSPFDNAFSDIITLSPFSEAEVDALLVRYQANFSLTERTYLRQVAGTHPYLVQLAGSLIVQARGTHAAAESSLAEIERELEYEAEGYFSAIFSYSSECEQMLLVLLALSPLSQHLPAGQASLGNMSNLFERYGQETDRLTRRGLVLKRPDGLALFSPIFGRWVLRQVVIAGGQDILSRWEPLYANFLSPVQKVGLEDLVDKVIRWPAIVKTPELLGQMPARGEVSLPSASD